jgi:hypothetical protein
MELCKHVAKKSWSYVVQGQLNLPSLIMNLLPESRLAKDQFIPDDLFFMITGLPSNVRIPTNDL